MWQLDRPFDVAPVVDIAEHVIEHKGEEHKRGRKSGEEQQQEQDQEQQEASMVQIGKLEGQMLFVGNRWEASHFQLYAACFDCVVAENVFNGSFAASWGRNPHALFGGWQPNLQVEWNDNTIIGESV
jgi:hypothetical protein